MSEDLLAELKSELQTVSDLDSAAAVLDWDQATYMPPKGADARARQMALLGRLAHEHRTAPRMGELLEGLRAVGEGDDADAGLVRRARRDYERAVRLPTDFVDELKQHGAASYVAWTKARPDNDFKAIEPYLDKTLELSRRVADFFPDAAHVADPFIDEMDAGMTVKTVQALFDELRAGLVPLVEAIADRPRPDTSFFDSGYAKADQLAFGRAIIEELGYDYTRGRQDETHHPFMTRFGSGDIRITTRVNKDDPTEALFGTIHEAGHALYELNIDPGFDGGPLGQGTSAGVHESQSRTWENLVGRSRGFWKHFFPLAQRTFAKELAGVDAEAFYRAVNKVERSPVRTAADEVTYNLHVMLRFGLELRMLEGELAVKDLPDAWNERMKSDLGLTPPDNRDGCMQDVHWYCTTIGGTFQGYTLGNLMSAQFYDAALVAHPEIPERVAQGEFAPLRGWLADNVYQHGARYLPMELVERATGRALEVKPFLAYLTKKYSDLYEL